MDLTLANMMQSADELARIAFTKDGDVQPIWIVATPSEDTKKPYDCHIISTPFDGVVSKQKIDAAMRRFIDLKQALFYVFTSEAWALSAKMGDEHPDGIADHPDRTEIIQIIGESRDGQMYHWAIPIDTKTRALGPTEKREQERGATYAAHNRFMNMFPPVGSAN